MGWMTKREMTDKAVQLNAALVEVLGSDLSNFEVTGNSTSATLGGQRITWKWDPYGVSRRYNSRYDVDGTQPYCQTLSFTLRDNYSYNVDFTRRVKTDGSIDLVEIAEYLRKRSVQFREREEANQRRADDRETVRRLLNILCPVKLPEGADESDVRKRNESFGRVFANGCEVFIRPDGAVKFEGALSFTRVTPDKLQGLVEFLKGL